MAFGLHSLRQRASIFGPLRGDFSCALVVAVVVSRFIPRSPQLSNCFKCVSCRRQQRSSHHKRSQSIRKRRELSHPTTNPVQRRLQMGRATLLPFGRILARRARNPGFMLKCITPALRQVEMCSESTWIEQVRMFSPLSRWMPQVILSLHGRTKTRVDLNRLFSRARVHFERTGIRRRISS